MSKATAAIVARRVEEVLQIILDGAAPWDICTYVRTAEKEVGSAWELPPEGKPLSDSQIRRYAARATAMIGESCRASRKKLLRRHLGQRRNLYAKAVSQGDLRAALSVLRDEAELEGLYDHKLAEIEKRLTELERARGAKPNGKEAISPDAKPAG